VPLGKFLGHDKINGELPQYYLEQWGTKHYMFMRYFNALKAEAEMIAGYGLHPYNNTYARVRKAWQ